MNFTTDKRQFYQSKLDIKYIFDLCEYNRSIVSKRMGNEREVEKRQKLLSFTFICGAM